MGRLDGLVFRRLGNSAVLSNGYEGFLDWRRCRTPVEGQHFAPFCMNFRFFCLQCFVNELFWLSLRRMPIKSLILHTMIKRFYIFILFFTLTCGICLALAPSSENEEKKPLIIHPSSRVISTDPDSIKVIIYDDTLGGKKRIRVPIIEFNDDFWGGRNIGDFIRIVTAKERGLSTKLWTVELEEVVPMMGEVRVTESMDRVKFRKRLPTLIGVALMPYSVEYEGTVRRWEFPVLVFSFMNKELSCRDYYVNETGRFAEIVFEKYDKNMFNGMMDDRLFQYRAVDWLYWNSTEITDLIINRFYIYNGKIREESYKECLELDHKDMESILNCIYEKKKQ